MDKVVLNAKMITNYVGEILMNNSSESAINIIEFEFGDKYESYLTDEFKSILDDYFKVIGGTYSFEQVRPKVVKFYVDITNASLKFDYTWEDKGFETRCLNCGSTDVEDHEDYDEGYDGEYFLLGTYKVCNNCGQRS